MATEDPPAVLERFNGNLDLVDVVARQLSRTLGRTLELQELVSYGREGLLDAARRFDASRGVPFRGYATFRVRGAIIDGVRSISQLPRRTHERLMALQAASRYTEGAAEDTFAAGAAVAPAEASRLLGEHLAGMAAALTMGLVVTAARGEEGELVGVSGDDSPEEAVARAHLRSTIRAAIEDLPDPEGVLVRRHYLDGDRFDHVAADLGLSKSWASRLHTRALQRLSKRLRGLDSG